MELLFSESITFSTSTLPKTSRHGSTGPWRCSSAPDTARQPTYGAQLAWWARMLPVSMSYPIDISSIPTGASCGSKQTHQNSLFLCLCWILRPLSSPRGTTCLNRILGKIIPGMKVVLFMFYPIRTVQHYGNGNIYILTVDSRILTYIYCVVPGNVLHKLALSLLSSS